MEGLTQTITPDAEAGHGAAAEGPGRPEVTREQRIANFVPTGGRLVTTAETERLVEEQDARYALFGRIYDKMDCAPTT